MHERRRALAPIPLTDMPLTDMPLTDLPLTDLPQTEQDHFLYPEQGNLVIYYPVSQ